MRRAALIAIPTLLACGPFFYQAPPSIGNYPERVSAKRWQHLFQEKLPLDPALPDAAKLDATCRQLPSTLGPLTVEKRLAEIDRLLSENRSGPYSSQRANFLHELRELAADDGVFAAAKDYIAWRSDGDVPLPPNPPAEKPWNMEEQEFAALRQFHDFRVKHRATFLNDGIAAAVPQMQPYWLVRRGSFLFDSGDPAAAAVDFAAVMEEFPDHPRAEVAMLMLARCRIEEARRLLRANPAGLEEQEIPGLFDEAEAHLTNFIECNPKGRFAADAEGWIAAAAFSRGQLGKAVRHQLARLDRQPTREITRSVLRECDFIFEKLLESRRPGATDAWLDPDEVFDAAAIARHPLVARLFVQNCIDPAAHISLPLWWDDDDNGGRATIDFLKRRILNPDPFVKLALAELGKELLKIHSRPDATTLTLLAWSATEDGEHEQALALLDGIDAGHLTDESLLARATILQRQGRHAEAVESFERLAASFPASPLMDDQPFRKSVSLFRSGQAGKAIAVILPLAMPGQETPTQPVHHLHPAEETMQWLDTMIQFAPLAELEPALANCGGDVHRRRLLGDIIRMRAIAGGRFDLAERNLTDEAAEPGPAVWDVESKMANARRMGRAAWDQHVVPLMKLQAELAANPGPSESARLHLAIAKHWMEHRGRLTLPALALGYYAGSEEEKQDLLRRRNALEIGFPRETVHRELDRRDEATHAFEHALEAAKCSDPAIAAPALELANECLFRRAEFSLYQKSRAMETGASELSASLHRQLRERFPASPEAKRAVFFTFTPAAGPWMPGDYNPSNSAQALMGALEGRSLDEEPEDNDALQKIAALEQRVAGIDAQTPLPAVRAGIEAAKRELDALRALTEPGDQKDIIAVVDRFDDLLAAASLPGIRPADYQLYAAGKFDTLPPVFRSLLDFRDRTRILTDVDGNEKGPRNDTIAGWQEYLETWPESPKSEAASFRLTRLIARKHRTSRRILAIHFPEAPIPGGYKHVEVERMDASSDPAETLAAIERHEERFPLGRYRDDLNLLRAGAMIDSKRPTRALELLDSILSNPAQRDLHVIAALDFADIAQRLLDPAQRLAVAKALRRSPNAMGRLRLLVDGDTFLSRLQPLMPWLEGK